jgi:hypothetical protein
VPGIIDTRACAFSRSSGDDANAPIHVARDDLEHTPPFRVVQARDFPSNAKRRYAIDLRIDEEIDDPAQARLIEIAVLREWGGENGIDASQLQFLPPMAGTEIGRPTSDRDAGDPEIGRS